MMPEFTIENANAQQKQVIISLLSGNNLPVEDLPSSLDNFLVAIAADNIIGAIGLERHENFGLLRSLVVREGFRNNKVASHLIQQLESKATRSGIRHIYLFTETAPLYFEGKGYKKISRGEVPGAIQASSEFASVCPASAIVMTKSFPQR
jgi:amino-acid N-acetyltransferase